MGRAVVRQAGGECGICGIVGAISQRRWALIGSRHATRSKRDRESACTFIAETFDPIKGMTKGQGSLLAAPDWLASFRGIPGGLVPRVLPERLSRLGRVAWKLWPVE
jgi:hypothetical protein